MGNNDKQLNFNKYSELLDAIPIATVYSDCDNAAIHINQKFIELFGYQPEEVPTIYDWFIKAYPDQEKRDKVIKDWESSFNAFREEKRKPLSYETAVVCKDGCKLYIEMNIKLISDCIIYTFFDVTEHKIHEKELIKHKQFLERAQQISRIGYWELNLCTKKVWASSQAKDIYGFNTDEELTFENIKNIVLPEYRKLLDKKMDALIYEDENYNISFQIMRKNDNAIIDIHSVAEYSKTDNKIFGVIRDITRRKNDERELIEKQDRIFEILNSSPSAIACFDNEFNLVFFNKKCTEVLGYSNSDVENIYDWFNLAYPNAEYREKVIKNWEKSIDQEVSVKKDIVPLEAYVNCKDGNVRYIQFNTKLFSDLTLISMVDLTENKKALNIIAESEKKYRSLFENSTDAIIVIKNNRYEFVNPSYLAMFGYEKESEIINMDPNHLVAENYRALVNEFTDKRNKGEEVPIYYETKGIKKDGSIFDISVKVSSYTMNSEQYMLVIIRDISDRITDKEELIIAKEKAEEADKLKSAFLANMSHEIRTPLNAIMGFSQLICDSDIETDQLKEFTEIIRKRSEDLLEIINDILDISRLEAGQIYLYYNKDNLYTIFKEITELFKSKLLIDNTGVELKVNYNLDTNQSYINTDFGRLKQILINLISNAIKFTKVGSVEICCKLIDSQTLLFYVKDTGIGIPKDKLDVIFERFIQADNSTTRLYGGTGLGLSICKSLIELFNGEIWVESEVNKGSTFYFTIPYESAKKNETKQEIITKQYYDWSDKTILIIEDDAYNAIYINDVIASTKTKIFKVENAREALEIFKQNEKIDLVLMDILLPDENGYNLTKILLSLKPDQIIIAQTAFASDDDRRKCISVGCKDFISKPINKKELLALLDKYLSK